MTYQLKQKGISMTLGHIGLIASDDEDRVEQAQESLPFKVSRGQDQAGNQEPGTR